jgi:7-carboxy-7-deazaguanine synthase
VRSTSTPERDPEGDGEWADGHDRRRIDVDAVARLVESYEVQLEFVVTGDADVPEIERVVGRVRDAAAARAGTRTWYRCLGRDPGAAERDPRARGRVGDGARYRYTPRLHVAVRNDAPGT